MKTKFLFTTIFLSMCMCFGFVATNLGAITSYVINLDTSCKINISIEEDGAMTPIITTSSIDKAVEIVRKLQKTQTVLMLRTNSIELAINFSSSYFKESTNPLYVFDLDKTIFKRDPTSFGPDPDEIYNILRTRNSHSEDPNRFAIKSAAAVMSCAKMITGESATIPTLKLLQKKDIVRTLALTSRDPDLMMDITFNQLTELGIDFNTKSPSEKDFVFRNVGTYTGGIMFLQELQEKGTALNLLLDRFNRESEYTPSSIVFVDDSERHIQTVAKAMDLRKIPCLSFHYTGALGTDPITRQRLTILRFARYAFSEKTDPELDRILRRALRVAVSDVTVPSSPTEVRCSSVTRF